MVILLRAVLKNDLDNGTLNNNNTYYYVYFSKMLVALQSLYKITKNTEGKPIQRIHKKIHVPSSYREYLHTLNNVSPSLNDDDTDQVEDDQEWGFFVDIDNVPKIIIRQKNVPQIKIEYSYYKYIQKYTYFRPNKIVHEDVKYSSSFDSFDSIGCVEEATVQPAMIVRQTRSSTYLYEEIFKRIMKPRTSSSRYNRWYYKFTLVSLLVITCMSCAALVACVAFI